MTDTIELLETIGGDASLRYAAPDDLTGLLEQEQASLVLRNAVMSGDGAGLRQSYQAQHSPQTPTHGPGHGDDEGEGDDDATEPERRSPDRGALHRETRDSSR